MKGLTIPIELAVSFGIGFWTGWIFGATREHNRYMGKLAELRALVSPFICPECRQPCEERHGEPVCVNPNCKKWSPIVETQEERIERHRKGLITPPCPTCGKTPRRHILLSVEYPHSDRFVCDKDCPTFPKEWDRDGRFD